MTPGQRGAPGQESGGDPNHALKNGFQSIPRPTDRLRFNLARVLERRRASRQLDQLQREDRYPDVAVTYHLTATS